MIDMGKINSPTMPEEEEGGGGRKRKEKEEEPIQGPI
jgi:hypothetical protein